MFLKIEKLNCIKYLGIFVDNNLKYKSHIEHVNNIKHKLF